MNTEEKLKWMEDKLTKTFHIVSILRTNPSRMSPHSLHSIMNLTSDIHDTAKMIDDDLYHKNTLEEYLIKMGGVGA